MFRTNRVFLLLGLLVLIVGACTFEIQPRFEADAAEMQVLEFEVAENALLFAFDEAPVFDDGYPQYGNPFITKGYIYPVGTLTCDEEGTCNGVNEDGSPEFPDQVMGVWYCRGFMIGDGAHTTGEPWNFTTQLYDLGDEPGTDTIISNGYEHPDIGSHIARAVTGGTGSYATARGQVVESLLGFNSLGGISVRFSFELENQ